jgi:CCR4-NOT transcription complex subunit 7/8
VVLSISKKMSMLNPSTPAFEPWAKYSLPQRSIESVIKNVWKTNYKEEILRIANLVEKYPFVAMDTEFPGIIVRPQGEVRDPQYQTIRANVDRLKLIQVGITLSDEHGNFPPDTSTWQFNLKFDLKVDTYSEDSIQLLKTSGIDFEMHCREGIDPMEFAELFTVSGLVLNEDLVYITFHSGYDFAYLLKSLTCQKLPETQIGFYQLLKTYFPVFYDLKHIVRGADHYRGGLNRLAEVLGIKRIGRMHQGGSDSLVTLEAFFKLQEEYMEAGPIQNHQNVICGLEEGTQEYSSL